HAPGARRCGEWAGSGSQRDLAWCHRSAVRCIVLMGLFWVMLPTAVFGLFLLTLPPPDPPPWWRAAASRWTERVRERWAGRRRADPPPPDPFAALRLQVRLGVLAEHIRQLENDPRVWARARRLEAAWA